MRAQRLAEARRREKVVNRVLGRRPGESERAAIKRLAKADRSTFRRWQREYGKLGLDGLIDSRVPPEPRSIPAAVREVICTLRRADPQCDVSAIIAHV